MDVRYSVWYPMTPMVVDEHLQLLANVHRRRVLEYLRRGRRQVATVDELVDHLRAHQEAGWGADVRGRDRIKIALVHEYLPRLDEEGVVDWDRRHDEVSYRETAVVDRVLDALPEDSMTVEG